ncbi:MAG: VOC family protein [bacterium]
MKLYAVRIFTTDWDRSVDFYRETVGLPLKLIDQEFLWAEFDLGGASLGIEAIDANAPNARDLVGRFVGVSLLVDDIDSAYTQLRAKGVRFTAPPESQTWGGTLAHFKDPDDNVLTLFGM